MDERELTGQLPNEVVEVYRQKDYREVVEVYERPLPWLAAPETEAEPPRKKRRKLRWILLLLVLILGFLAAVGWCAVHLWALRLPEVVAPYVPNVVEQVTEEVYLPLWEGESDAALEVFWEQGEALTVQEIYQRVNPAVVMVLNWRGETAASVGTGVVFTEDGFLLTNYHNVCGGTECVAVLEDGTMLEALYVAGDPEYDLAILKIDAVGMPAAEFGDSDRLQVGDPAYAIGNPLGIDLRGTLTDGIISAINRDVWIREHAMTVIQTNAALNSGNSGGPLINQYGQVVGINTAKMKTPAADEAVVEGLGFAIPSATLDRVVNDLLTYGEVQPEPLLGISVYNTGTELEEGLVGAEVESVVPDGAGDRAGIRAGDYVLFAGEIEVSGSGDVLRARRQYHVGDQMPMTIWRDGEKIGVVLDLQDAVE